MTIDPGEFAAAAWQVATSPIMAPPYLDWTAERLQAVTFTGSEEGAALIARVQVAVPRPAALAEVRGFADWDRGDRWNRGYHTPADDALARRPAMLTSSLLLFEIGAGELYVPQDAPEALTVADAKASVRRLAELVTARMAPIMSALDSAGVAR